MHKRVLVIASGNTERLALPHLTAHLQDHGITIDVRIPPKGQAISANVVHQIIQATRYAVPALDKYVVLMDVDGKDPADVLRTIRCRASQTIDRRLPASVLYAYAQWHLEAWFFADASNLREYLDGRALGNVDTTQPDRIQNPKEHLKNLLPGHIYTSRTSAAIAESLDANTIVQRSPSFAGFLTEVRNGSAG